MQSISYKKFVEDTYLSESGRTFRIFFTTPTSFKINGEYMIYPLISEIYKNIIHRFDSFSTGFKVYDETTLNTLIDNTAVIGYNLRSTSYHLESIRIPSFTGSLTVRVYKTTQLAQLANMIFKYAEYSGCGIKTALGMGSIKVKIKKENIKKFITSYDYSAAKVLADEIKDFLPDTAYKLISAAAERFRLNYPGVKQLLDGTDIEIIPEKSDKKRDITEYLLWLGVVLKKHDYLGFIRGITPAAMALMEAAVEYKTKYGDIKQYCQKGKGGLYTISQESLSRSENGGEIIDILQKQFKAEVKSTVYTSAHLEAILAEACTDEDIKHYARIIRVAERDLRNPAAHSIICIDDTFIMRKMHKTAEQLYSDIKKFSIRINLMRKDIWDSYEKMNDRILELL